MHIISAGKEKSFFDQALEIVNQKEFFVNNAVISQDTYDLAKQSTEKILDLRSPIVSFKRAKNIPYPQDNNVESLVIVAFWQGKQNVLAITEIIHTNGDVSFIGIAANEQVTGSYISINALINNLNYIDSGNVDWDKPIQLADEESRAEIAEVKCLNIIKESNIADIQIEHRSGTIEQYAYNMYTGNPLNRFVDQKKMKIINIAGNKV